MKNNRRTLIHESPLHSRSAPHPASCRLRHRIGRTNRSATSFPSLPAARPTSWRARSARSSAQLTALIKSDVPRLGKIVKESGAKAD